MIFDYPSRLLAVLRHLLVLLAVVVLLAPETAHAGMGMMEDPCVTDTKMDVEALHTDGPEIQSMDHCAGDPCAGLMCFYAMPFAAGPGTLLSVVIRVDNLLANNVPLGSINPATLRKPPKFA